MKVEQVIGRPVSGRRVPGMFVLALLVATSASAQVVVPVTPELPVDGVGGPQGDPAVARLGDGFAVAWSEDSFGFAEIFLRGFDAGLAELGPAVGLSAAGPDHPEDRGPALLETSGGALLAAWTSEPAVGGNSSELVGRVVSAGGALGPILRLDSGLNVRPRVAPPAIVANDDDTVLVGWRRDLCVFPQTGFAVCGLVYARPFDDALAPLGAQRSSGFWFQDGYPAGRERLAMVARPGGGAIVGYTTSNLLVGGAVRVQVRALDADGRPDGATSTLSGIATLDTPVALAVSGAGALAAWHGPVSLAQPDERVHVRPLDANGAPAAPATLVDADPDGEEQLEPMVVALGDDRYAVLWISRVDGVWTQRLRLVGLDGSPIGSTVELPREVAAMVAADDDELVVVHDTGFPDHHLSIQRFRIDG